MSIRQQQLSRRSLFLAGSAGLAALAATRSGHAQETTNTTGSAEAQLAPHIDLSQPAVTVGRVRQSVMGWCFNPMPAVELALHAKKIGLVAIEGIGKEHYPAVKKLGLEISLVGSHGFKEGPLNPDYHSLVETKLREAIDLAVAVNCSKVITFTGMRAPGISDEAAKANCLTCWKKVIGYAEQKKITLVLEHLNSRDDSHPMKGHPGYWGDDLELCADLIAAMDSPHFKLLFDLYHVQIMHGDLIRNLRHYAPITGHYHTAGNPGRGELDMTQEIFYPPVIRAILETGYRDYIAQEFIPTWDDPIAALWHAAKICDV